MKKSIKRLLGVTVAATALLLGAANTAKSRHDFDCRGFS